MGEVRKEEIEEFWFSVANFYINHISSLSLDEQHNRVNAVSAYLKAKIEGSKKRPITLSSPNQTPQKKQTLTSRKHHPNSYVSWNAPYTFPHVDVIPMSMRGHLTSHQPIHGGGNCGYRAIAEAMGIGQDRWRYIRRSMIDQLKEYPLLIEKTLVSSTVGRMLEALDHFGPGSAPEDTWLAVPNMGCLVATTFNCAFVVLGGINVTFLPLNLMVDQTNGDLKIPVVCICLLTSKSHFISVSLSESSPLPEVYYMWDWHRSKSAARLVDQFRSRLEAYETASNVIKHSCEPIQCLSENAVSTAPYTFPHVDVIPMSMRGHLTGHKPIHGDGNCGYRAIAEALGIGQKYWRDIRGSMIDKLNEYPLLMQNTFAFSTVGSMLEALDHFGSSFAPMATWLTVPDMGCLVATTFNCAFVVLGGLNKTFLPLNHANGDLKIPIVCICLLTSQSHFISVSLSENSPLPEVYTMWDSHRSESAARLVDQFRSRLEAYKTASNVIKHSCKPIQCLSDSD